MSETTGRYQPDEAFLSAKAGMQFLGQPLRKFSYSRVIAAQAMGLRAPDIGTSALDQFRETGVYAGALRDVIIFLWLSLQRDASEPMTLEEWKQGAFTPERAMQETSHALRKAYEWAEAVGITDTNTPNFLAGYELLLQVRFQIDASAFEVEVKSPDGPKPPAQAIPKESPAPVTPLVSSPTSPSKAGKRKNSSGRK